MSTAERSASGRRGRARGTRLELEVAKQLRKDGWVVGSMRQNSGGGDLIASSVGVATSGAPRPVVRLIEVKGTAGGPWERFGPAARAEMLDYADRAGASAWMAWRPAGARVVKWIPSSEWPS